MTKREFYNLINCLRKHLQIWPWIKLGWNIQQSTDKLWTNLERLQVWDGQAPVATLTTSLFINWYYSDRDCTYFYSIFNSSIVIPHILYKLALPWIALSIIEMFEVPFANFYIYHTHFRNDTNYYFKEHVKCESTDL